MDRWNNQHCACINLAFKFRLHLIGPAHGSITFSSQSCHRVFGLSNCTFGFGFYPGCFLSTFVKVVFKGIFKLKNACLFVFKINAQFLIFFFVCVLKTVNIRFNLVVNFSKVIVNVFIELGIGCFKFFNGCFVFFRKF